jgi:GNAT superfamily N-acetyltransferase
MKTNKTLIRKATKADVPGIVQLLANDVLGRQREDVRLPLPAVYVCAFDIIDADKQQELVVMEDEEQQLIGTLQLSFIQYLTHQGSMRAQVEAVRVTADRRGEGLGEQLLRWAIHRAKERGAQLLQLTTDKSRPDALRFYEQLGFVASHEGMKLHFTTNSGTDGK